MFSIQDKKESVVRISMQAGPKRCEIKDSFELVLNAVDADFVGRVILGPRWRV